jgi:hypothetical protein
VIVAAAALKGARLRKRGLPPEQRPAFAAGTAASFGSTLASQALIRMVERDSALWPYAVYRAGLAVLVLGRLAARRRTEREQVAATVVFGNGKPTDAASEAAARAAETAARAHQEGE